jgi:hypothetical protein
MRFVRGLFSTICMVVFLATMYVLIQWFTTSIVITRNGPVHWAEGWERTVEYWCESAQL